MKILVIGSGGREHALAWKFAQSEKVERIFVAPGNGGTATEAKCENVLLAADPSCSQGREALRQFAQEENIDLTVVGPEQPLAEGISDFFREAGLAVIGPGKKAAQLEASKIYSKNFMATHGVRTGRSKSFTDLERANAFARKHFSAALTDAASLVIKADGLAAGKGVVIAQNLKDAEAALSSFMHEKSLGGAGTSVLLEEYLEGTEVSILAAASVKGSSGYILPFIPARDHKQRFDGGQGQNTGGMGAIAPAPGFSPTAHNDFTRAIVEPTLKGMIAEGLDYCGFIFFGLMMHKDRCFLLEYNVRLGDPETQAVLPLMDFDLVDMCNAMLSGEGFPLTWKKGAVCAPVAVADGYPGPYRKGDTVTVDAAAFETSGATLFVSGATMDNGTLRTSGGRVLTVSAYGENPSKAQEAAYQGLAAIRFDGMAFRQDIRF